MEKKTHIIHDLCDSTSGSQGHRLYTITNIGDGKTQAVVELRVLKRFKIQDLEKAEKLIEQIDHRCFNLDKIVKNA